MSTLRHYGVKGMKWGVRKDRSSGKSTSSSSTSKKGKRKLSPEMEARAKKLSSKEVVEAMLDYEKKTGKSGWNSTDGVVAFEDYLTKNPKAGLTKKKTPGPRTLTKEETARAKKMSSRQTVQALKDYEAKTGKKGANKADIIAAYSDYLAKHPEIGADVNSTNYQSNPVKRYGSNYVQYLKTVFS